MGIRRQLFERKNSPVFFSSHLFPSPRISLSVAESDNGILTLPRVSNVFVVVNHLNIDNFMQRLCVGCSRPFVNGDVHNTQKGEIHILHHHMIKGHATCTYVDCDRVETPTRVLSLA